MDSNSGAELQYSLLNLRADDILIRANAFGRFQLFAAALGALAIAPGGASMNLLSFLKVIPIHHCKENTEDPNELLSNHSTCHMPANETESCTNGYIYDTSIYSNTIASQFDLVCDKDSFVTYIFSSFFIGQIFGALFCGSAADTYGRRVVFLNSILFLAVMWLVTAAMQGVVSLSIIFFIVGFIQQFSIVTSLTYVVESLAGRARVLSQLFSETFWVVGQVFVSLIAFLFRDWRILCVALAIPLACVGILLFFLLPESLHWLVANEKFADVNLLLDKIARWNNVPRKALNYESVYDEDGGSKQVPKSKFVSFVSIFRHKFLVVRTITGAFQWGVLSLTYYGLMFASVTLPGDPFVNNALAALIEIPAIVFSPLLLKYMNRRSSNAMLFALAGISCLSGYTCTEVFGSNGAWSYVLTITSLLGKMFITGAWLGCIVHHAEMFPTTLRTIGVGFVCSFARLVTVTVPLILYFSPTSHFLALPFGVLAMLAAISEFWLPETANQVLSENPEQMNTHEVEATHGRATEGSLLGKDDESQ